MLKKKYIPFIVLVIVLGVMTLTNPGKERFRDYMTEQLISCKFPEKYIQDSLVISRIHNYILVSKYSFHINDSGIPMQGYYVGAFGFFFEVGTFTKKEE